MKTVFLCAMCFLLLISFGISAEASEEIYTEITEALGNDALRLLEDLGFSGLISGDVTEISPVKALKTVAGVFSGELTEPLKTSGIVLTLLFITAVICNFLPEKGSLTIMGKSIALMCIMFSIISICADLFTDCCSALLITEDFMLVLIPILAGVISFSGNPSLALSFNTVAFSFSQLVAYFFTEIVPSLSSVLMAVCSAGAINPLMKTSGIGKTLAKIINLIMAFVAGIFVAVLSIRGVVAGAADTVGIRGVRFLIGNTVPVVGSALGEALNSIVAGISLIKNTVGMLGIAAVLVINLPVLIKVIIWKGALYFISVAADCLDTAEIKSFSENMNGILSVIIGAVCFTSFVFTISIAIILTVGRRS